MAAAADRPSPRSVHPFQAALLAAMVPLFLGGLLSDIAYADSYEIQWSNFAAWLIAGAMVFTGFALLWASIDLVRGRRWRGRSLVLFLVLLALFVLGLINSFVHARDAWAVMPDGLILSAVVTLLALVAAWTGFSSFSTGGAK